MAIAPDALLAFGECCRNMGRHADREVIPQAFLAQAWIPAVRSAFSGQLYGLVSCPANTN